MFPGRFPGTVSRSTELHPVGVPEMTFKWFRGPRRWLVLGLSVGLVGLVGCVGPVGDRPATPRAPISQVAMEALFEGLHRPVYEVYQLGRDRDRLHDHLARSFRGEALTREYVEHFSALRRMRRDATSIRVLRVDYESIELLAWDDQAGRATVDVLWSVGGVVRHRRHHHPRTNRYRAVYELVHGADGWRLEDTKLRDMRRVRGFSSVTGSGGEAPKSGAGLMSPLELLQAGMVEDVKALQEERAQREKESEP